MSKAKSLISVLEVIQGKKEWEGTTDKGQEVSYGQRDNGMFYAQLKDDEGNISSTIGQVPKDIWSWMYNQGIRKISWSDGRKGTITALGGINI